MVDNKSIVEQLTEFHKIIDDLENIEVKIDDEDKGLLLLSSLPRSFEHFKDALLYGKEGTITLDEVQTAVKSKEFSKSKDLKIEDNGEDLNVSRGGGGRKGMSKSKRSDKSKIKCFNCQKIGHFRRDCPERKVNEDSVQVAVALGDESYEDADVLVVSSLETEDSWVIDSGCSYHMCPRIEYFETLKMVQGGVVRLGDNKACKVHGIGTVRLKMFDDRELLIHNVRYVPELKRNLLSISMFDDLGYCTRVEHGVLKISRDELIIAKGSKICGLYILEGSNVVIHSSLTSGGFHDKEELWDLSLRRYECLEKVSEEYNEFCRNQGIKMHVTAELLLSFWGRAEVKTTYLVGREFLQKKNSENQGRKPVETITEKTQFEVEFPTMDASSSEGTVTEISDYHLTHDKVRRVIVASQRDGYASLGYYVFNVAEGLQNKRRKTFREAFENRWSQGWLKNHTCRLVKLPRQKRVIGNKWMQVARSRFKGCLNLIKVFD